jgi:hypothetical protein
MGEWVGQGLHRSPLLCSGRPEGLSPPKSQESVVSIVFHHSPRNNGHARRHPVLNLAASLVLTAVVLLGLGGSSSSANSLVTPINLGAAESAALVAASTITDAGASTVAGDIALSPGTSITGFPPAVQTSGSLQVANASAVAAQGAASSAYTDAVGRASTQLVTTDLGGRTYGPGVFQAATALALTGTVTLDAGGNPDAVFIFQAGTTLTTSASSAVVLTGGANACNVFWSIGSSATLGAATEFAGSMLIYSSATLGALVHDTGRILAINGAITLAGDNINVPVCGPSAPLSPQQADGDSSSLVSWNAPMSVGSAAVSGYSVQTMLAGGSGWQDASMCQGVTTLSCRVTGLDNANAYTFRVRASNPAGSGGTNGTWSTPTVATYPPLGTPTVLAGDASALVSWTPLVDAFGNPVPANYVVTSFPGPVICTSTATSCVVTGLINGMAYNFTVEATDGSGASKYSPHSGDITPVSSMRVPVPPVITSVTGSKSTISIAFTPPIENGGSAITGYLGTCLSTDGGFARFNIPKAGRPAVTASPLTIGGVTNGKTYTCMLRASNVTGNSVPSSASGTVVPGMVPRVPRMTGVTASGSSAISVAFKIPTLSGGYTISSYIATCTSSNGGATGSSMAGVSPITVTALTRGASYTCSVVATNLLGTSPVSNPSKSLTLK